MKTAVYLTIMIAVAVVVSKLPNANWLSASLLVMAGVLATIKAVITSGD